MTEAKDSPNKLDILFHRAAYLKKKRPLGKYEIGEKDQYGLDVIWEYESLDLDIAHVRWYDWVIGIICIILKWPFNATVLISFYCVFLLIVTFISSFLVAYISNPIYALMDDNAMRTASAFIALITSSPIVAFIFYVLCQVILNVIDGVQEIVFISISAIPTIGSEVCKARTSGRLWVFILRTAIFLIAGIGLGYLTLFVEGCSIIVGCILFLFAPFGILINFIAPFVGYFVLLFWNICRIPGCDFTNLVYRWVRKKAAGDLSPGERAGNMEERREREHHKEQVGSVIVLLKIALSFDYFWIGNFADHVIRAGIKKPWKRTIGTVMMWVLTGLNIFVIVTNISEYHDHPEKMFLMAQIIHIVLLPVLVFFHPAITWIHTVKKVLLKWVLRTSAMIAVVAMIGIGISFSQLTNALDEKRLANLPPLPENYSRKPAFVTDHPFCNEQYGERNLIELIGLSFGGYVHTNPVVFGQQMAYVLGPEWDNDTTYSVQEIIPNVPCVIYRLGDLVVFSFRGFTTTQELALEVEVLARYYVLPLLLNLTPLYDHIKEWWLERYTALAYFFGLHWFSPMSHFNNVVEGIHTEYDGRGLGEKDKVVFVGSNIGGVFAKILGMITHHRGIGFISLPSLDEDFSYRYGSDEMSTRWGTNIYVGGGYFGVPDLGIAEDYRLPGDSESGGLDDIYQSFCLLAEICGHHMQFEAYCSTVIGSDKLRKIIEFLTASTST
jgi:hypothetical protein